MSRGSSAMTMLLLTIFLHGVHHRLVFRGVRTATVVMHFVAFSVAGFVAAREATHTAPCEEQQLAYVAQLQVSAQSYQRFSCSTS